jgi:hypothetical protein
VVGLAMGQEAAKWNTEYDGRVAGIGASAGAGKEGDMERSGQMGGGGLKSKCSLAGGLVVRGAWCVVRAKGHLLCLSA